MHDAVRRAGLAALGLFGGLCASLAGAGEPWLAPGDLRLRHDLLLLVDEGVIDLPVSAWPIAASDLAHALAGVSSEREAALGAAQVAALARLRLQAREGEPELGARLTAAARPTPLRSFAGEPREEGELEVHASGFVGNRWGGRLQLGVIADPDDGHELRMDGSYVAGKFGNWIVTAGAPERWWGSGWEGSLILGNSARPVPGLSLDRAVSEPFESRWLSWIGPWRLSTFMGYMEGDRDDYDHPLLFGFRVSARPLDGLEISLERTAQWCGEGRSCDWDDFWNLWVGNDNAGENVDAEDEPGNQLAGWDVRWASPIGEAPYAFYWQHTGESIDNNIPRPYRSMELAGLETWGGNEASSWRASLEWASTRCGGTENEMKLWDCAYNNTIFTDGYRAHGRPLAHSMDGDGDAWSLRYLRVPREGQTWAGLLRYAQVNEGGAVPDPKHSVAPGPETWWTVDLTHRRVTPFGEFELGLGLDHRDRDWDADSALLPRAWLSWRQGF